MQKIDYVRTKTSSSDKIIRSNGEFKVQRTVTTKGFDHILDRWDKIGSETKILPLSEIGAFKELNQEIFVKRTNVNPLTLQNMELWLKVTRRIEVTNKSNNIYLTSACGRIFQTDLTTTVAIPQNTCPQGLKITKISESPLTQVELQKLNEDLNNPKCLVKPLIAEENQAGELKLLC